MFSHPFLRALVTTRPTFFSVQLDGTEIYRGKFTTDGVVTIRDDLVDLKAPRQLLTIFFDDVPMPVYSIALDGEVSQKA